ncbi:MAG: phosphate acyltransferase PlsX [Actinomycetota bacterium]|nr:phosphate acyltransferase PlsX [Actinomycetota bacterium]
MSAEGHVATPVRVALDLLGGDEAPAAVVEGALLALREHAGVAIVLVGPTDVAERLLEAAGPPRRLADRLELVEAADGIAMGDSPLEAVSSKPGASVMVAARLVADGAADATVSAGSTGAMLLAALMALGRLPGITRPALAAVVPATGGPVVLLDSGANRAADAGLLAQWALAGSAYAEVRLGLARPRVGLLSIGEEDGKGDALRREAFGLLAELPLDFVGNVEGRDVPLRGAADVVVTDGFTGNVLLKGLEGALVMAAAAVRTAGAEHPDLQAMLPTLAEAVSHLDPDRHAAGMLLGVDGVAVVGHGASSPRAVATCVMTAADAVADGLVPRVAAAFADLQSAGPVRSQMRPVEEAIRR